MSRDKKPFGEQFRDEAQHENIDANDMKALARAETLKDIDETLRQEARNLYENLSSHVAKPQIGSGAQEPYEIVIKRLQMEVFSDEELQMTQGVQDIMQACKDENVSLVVSHDKHRFREQTSSSRGRGRRPTPEKPAIIFKINPAKPYNGLEAEKKYPQGRRQGWGRR